MSQRKRAPAGNNTVHCWFWYEMNCTNSVLLHRGDASIYYAPQHLQWDTLTNRWLALNNFQYQPTQTHLQKKNWFTTCIGPCMACVGFLRCHMYACACDGCADVCGIFWENDCVDIFKPCACVSGFACVGDLMYECICVTVCLGAYESGFAMYKCTNIDVLDGGVENTRRWAPEMDVWGQAPHHMHNRSSH